MTLNPSGEGKVKLSEIRAQKFPKVYEWEEKWLGRDKGGQA
jgi:hypothetical protein